jgi:aspartate racemase
MIPPSNSLPRIGILGGMGPMASADFLVKLVQATPASIDQEHFPTTLDSTPQIPDRPGAIDGSGPSPLPAMLEVLRRLESAGCSLIAMPCNTAHYWYEQLAGETNLPIVHIADAAAVWLRQGVPLAKRVGILGTAVTCKLGIYSTRLGDEWEWVYPSGEELDTLVTPAIAAIKKGDPASARALFLEVVNRMTAKGVDAIVLACTEIPLVLTQSDVAVPAIDSTEALARQTVAVAQAMHKSE